MKGPTGPDDPADPREGEDIADAGLDDFARAMADVRRLPPDPRGGRVRAGPHPPSLPHRAPPARTPARDAAADAEEAFVASGVDRRELRKLKRGDYAAGDRLDLHGLMATEAVAQVTRFIDRNRPRHRCVCIVHGRGLHSQGNVAVLKARIRATLRQHQAVLAFADAPRSDGGSGAVYVLLRK
jgi:DNA-nicking Smr family endonuclease